MGKRAAGRQDVFAEAVAIIRAEDEELRNALTKSESLVESSTHQMQSRFNSVRVSTASVGEEMGETGEATYSLGQVFSAVGAQAAAFGGTIGTIGGKVASLGGSFVALRSALFGLPGVLLAVGAAVSVLVSRWMAAKQAASEARLEFERATEVLQTREETLAKTLQAGEEQWLTSRAQRVGGERGQVQVAAQIAENKLLEERAQLEREHLQLASDIHDARQRFHDAVMQGEDEEATAQMERLAQAKETLKLIEQRERQIVALRAELIEGLTHKLAEIEEKHRQEQVRKDEEAARKRVEIWRQTATGMTAVAIQAVRKQESQMREVMGQFMIQMMSMGPGGMPGMGLFERVAAKLGLSFAGGGMGDQPGAMGAVPLRAFAATGAGGPADVLDKQRDKREQERTKDIGVIRQTLQHWVSTPPGWFSGGVGA